MQDMTFDLSEPTKWEYMFVGMGHTGVELPGEDEELDEFDDFDDEHSEEEKHLDMPATWVLPIELSLKDYNSRFVYCFEFPVKLPLAIIQK